MSAEPQNIDLYRATAERLRVAHDFADDRGQRVVIDQLDAAVAIEALEWALASPRRATSDA